MINLKNLDPNKIMIDEKSYKNSFICQIATSWWLKTLAT